MEAHDIALRPGGTYRMDLGGLGSAGYAWSYEVAGPDGTDGTVAVAIEQKPRPPLPPPGGPPPDSYSVEHILVVTAQREGNVTIVLALRRPWEKDKPPLREIRLRVTVGGGSGR